MPVEILAIDLHRGVSPVRTADAVERVLQDRLQGSRRVGPVAPRADHQAAPVMTTCSPLRGGAALEPALRSGST